MLIDAFPYAYGPEILLLRLMELDGLVDLHVIVECDTTHTGQRRELAWPALAVDPRFAPFVGKIQWCPITIPAGVDRPWVREEYIRSACLAHALEFAPNWDDVILFGDHDEIPHPQALALVVADGIKRARLWGAYHEWWLNLRAVGSPGYMWEFRQPITFRAGDRMTRFWDVRSGAELRALQWHGVDGAVELGRERWDNRGWHMTLQGGVQDVMDKLAIGAHTELQVLTSEQIQHRMDNRLDILDRCALEVCPPSLLPQTLTKHPEIFEGMILK